MPFTSAVTLSPDLGDFYVPRFEVRIAGAALPGEVLRDVTELTYKDDIKEIDGFELTINNWHEERQDFKYLSAETQSPTQDELEHLFDPCNKQIVVSMGYGDSLSPMVTGNFTTLEPHFPSGGAPTLTVRGLNVLHQLRRRQYTWAWSNKTDSQIAQDLATLTDRQTGQRRFPLPIATSQHAMGDERPITYVAERNQYDIDFLFRRARERGYVVVTRPRAGGRGATDLELYFGPSDDATPGADTVSYELGWRRTLIDFSPTLTTANQIRSVTVNGWNRATRQAIRETVTLDDQRLNVNRDLRQLLQSCDPREEVVVDEPVFTTQEARERATAILMDRQRSMVKATGTCIGLPGLRAGQRVNLVGLGRTFNGVYYLTSTTHTINDRGYTVHFEGRRENPPGGAS